MNNVVGTSISTVYSGQERNGGKTHAGPENGMYFTCTFTCSSKN